MLNKALEILSYIIILSVLVVVFSGVYYLLMLHFAPYTVALAVAFCSACLYVILKIFRDSKDR